MNDEDTHEWKKALPPYLEATQNSSNVAALRAIVLKVLQDADVFEGFDEIKQAMSIADTVIHNTLDLFSYGTVSDYEESPSNYLPLSDQALSKLRVLTVLSMIEKLPAQKINSIPYHAIQQTLWKENPENRQRQVESILLTLMAAEVVSGKLCQKTQKFIVSKIGRPRDVHPERDVPHIQLVLSNLSRNVTETLNLLEQQQAEMDKLAAEHKEPVEAMDVDDAGPSMMPRRQKRSRGGFSNPFVNF